MKKSVKKKRTGWHPADEPPKDEDWRLVCHRKLGWIYRAYYNGKNWITEDWNLANITHWHDYPELPKDED